MMEQKDGNTEQHIARHGVNRRQFLAAVAGAAGTAILAACSGGAAAPTATAAQTTATGAVSVATPTRAAIGASPSVGNTAPSVTPSAPSPAAGASGGQVSMLWVKPETLQPLFSTSGSEQQVERLLFGSLLKLSDKFDILPDLAEKIDAAPDAKTFTFALRKGYTFTDGQPFTVRDVVFTIERAVDKRTGSLWRSRLLNIVGAPDYGDQKADTIKGLATPDDYTLKISLTEPDGTFLATLGGYSGLGILPAHILKDVAPDQLKKQAFTLSPTVSAGAFQFATFQVDQYLELKRNESYGGTKAKLDRIFLKVLTPDTGLAQLSTGELDLMGPVPIGEIDRLKKSPQLSIVSVKSPSITRLVPNNLRPYLKDKRVRQAMMHAIDREALVKAVLNGEAEIVNSPIIGPDWMGQPVFNTYPYNPDKARQLLKDAGWDSSRKLELITVPGSKEEAAYLPIIQQEFKEVGIQMDVTNVDLVEKGVRARQNANYDLFTDGGDLFRMDPGVAATWFATDAFAPSGNNRARYSNPQVDQLFKQGQAIADTEQRKKIYTDVARFLNDEVPEVWLWSPNSIFAYNKRLVGFKPPGYVDNKLWNAEEWSVTK